MASRFVALIAVGMAGRTRARWRLNSGWGGLLFGISTLLTPCFASGTATSVVVAPSATSAVFGQTVVLTASITPSTATGHVTFYDGTDILGTATITTGSAALSTSGIGFGKRAITARYLGDSNYAASLSPSVTETITTNPGGTFNTSTTAVPVSGSVVDSLATADLNHDGYPDLVATNGNENPGGPSTVNVFLNNGNGTFATGVPYLSGTTAYKVAISDVDLDGNPDLIVTSPNGIMLLKGMGDGTFARDSVVLLVTETSTSPGPSDLSVLRIADVNLDGIPDIIVSRGTANAVAVLMGNGDGTFQNPITTQIGFAIADFAVSDVNGDGIPDLVLGGPSGVTLMTGAGDGTFSLLNSYPTPVVMSLAVADLNHDGVPDIVLGVGEDGGGGGSLSILPGTSGGAYQPAGTYPVIQYSVAGVDVTGIGVNSVSITDVDGDGVQTLFINGSDGYVVWQWRRHVSPIRANFSGGRSGGPRRLQSRWHCGHCKLKRLL